MKTQLIGLLVGILLMLTMFSSVITAQPFESDKLSTTTTSSDKTMDDNKPINKVDIKTDNNFKKESSAESTQSSNNFGNVGHEFSDPDPIIVPCQMRGSEEDDYPWSIAEVVSTESNDACGNQVSMFIDKNETVHIVWEDSSNYAGSGDYMDIFYKNKPKGEDWSITEVVSRETEWYAYWPSIVVDDEGTVHVAWYEGSTFGYSGSDSDIFYRKKPKDGTWATTEVISTNSYMTSSLPTLKLDPDGTTLHVIFLDQINENQSAIIYKKKPKDIGWGSCTREIVNISQRGVFGNQTITYGIHEPDLAIGPDGSAHVVWYAPDWTGLKNIYYKSNAFDGFWHLSQGATMVDDHGWHARVDVDSDNNVHIVWGDFDLHGNWNISAEVL